MGCEIGQNILFGSKYLQLKGRRKNREFIRHFDEKLRSFLKCQGYMTVVPVILIMSDLFEKE